MDIVTETIAPTERHMICQPACPLYSAAWVPPTGLTSRSVLELRTSVHTRLTFACFVILDLRKKRGRERMSSAMRFDILLAHGIHDIVFGMHPSVSWCKRWWLHGRLTVWFLLYLRRFLLSIPKAIILSELPFVLNQNVRGISSLLPPRCHHFYLLHYLYSLFRSNR